MTFTSSKNGNNDGTWASPLQNGRSCISRAKCPIQTKYIFHDIILQTVPSAKYLGVTDDLSWIPHIILITKKANQTLGYLERNIKVHNQDLKSTAYKILVRPQLEYSSTVWSPHTATNIAKVEAVQRRAARWATRDYQRTSSVTQMLKDLNWRTLKQRRIDSRLILMYRTTYDLIAIPAADYLIPNTRPSVQSPLGIDTDSHPPWLLQVHILSPYHSSLECPRTPHPRPSYCGTIQLCCVPSSPYLTLNTQQAFIF